MTDQNHVHTPRCRTLLGNLSEYIDGDLQLELCAELEEHLKGCENCRVVVNTLKKTVELYRSTTLPADLAPSIRERLIYKLDLTDISKKPKTEDPDQNG